MLFDLVKHIERQQKFSEKTFGPGTRTAGVVAHIRKELIEIESDPLDVNEWVDVILLAIDGAWRAGHSPDVIADAIVRKQARNEERSWPDWRTADPNGPIEHVKESFRAYQISDSEVWAAKSPEEAIEAAMKATGCSREEYSPIKDCYEVSKETVVFDPEHQSTIGEELSKVTEPCFICGDE